MSKTRIWDQQLNRVLYLHSEKSDAESLAVLLGRGHLERFQVIEHSSELGWFVKDKESGRIFDAQGLVQ